MSDWTEVTSSTIARVKHLPGKRELHVQFKSGKGTYAYHPVDAHEIDALLGAKSVGSHFHQFIKKPKTGRLLEEAK